MLNYKYCLLLLLVFLSSFSDVFAQCPTGVSISPNAPASICQGENVLLTANIAGPAGAESGVGFQWIRNGMDILGATDKTFQAVVSGQYNVRVTKTDCVERLSPPVALTVNPLPNKPIFNYSPTANDQCSGNAVTFTIANPEPNVSYVWDFGDGVVTPPITESFISHTYNLVGTGREGLQITVTATNATCQRTSDPQAISVRRKPNFKAPTDSANFNVCIPEDQDTIKVKAKLFNPAENTDAVRYIVNFGNGQPDTTYQAADFTSTKFIRNRVPYDTVGTFRIAIRAVGANGCETIFTKNFTVSKKPKAGFTMDDPPKKRKIANACVPVIVTAVDTTKGPGLTRKWEIKDSQGKANGFTFINGSNDTTKTAVLEFAIAGRYNIDLIITNACGTDTANSSVLIAYPEVQLQGDSTSCGPITMNFNQQMVMYDINLGLQEKSFAWTVTGPTGGFEYREGTSASSKYPVILFKSTSNTAPSEYKVSVVFENECGRSDFEEPAPPITITINPVPLPPTLPTNTASVCVDESVTITPAATTAILEYYDAATGGLPLGTGPNFVTGALSTSRTIYIGTKNPQGCTSATRVPFSITVLPAIQGNTIQAPQTVCSGSAPATLTGSVPTGGDPNLSFTYLWLRSTTVDIKDFQVAPGTNNSKDYTSPPLTETYFFRRIVQKGTCKADTSAAIRVLVNPQITNNTITNSTQQNICAGTAPTELVGSTPAGGNGTFSFVWESSTISETTGFGPATGSNNEENYSPGVLTQTTWFRRRVTSGGCTSESAVIRIEVVPNIQANANTIQEAQVICSNNTLPQPLTGSVINGVTYQWQSSTTNNPAGFTLAPGNATAATYTFPAALTVTTYFRRLVSVAAGSCEPVPSNVVEITVVPAIDNNTITASQTVVCEGTVPIFTGSTATGGNGTLIYAWESSITGPTSGFNPISNANSKDYTPGVISQNTWFRRTVRSSGATCAPVVSNVIAITVEKAPVAPTVEAASVTVCQGTAATLRVTSPASNTYEWYTTATGGAPVFFGQEYVTPPLTANTTYYVQAVSANKCVSAARTPVTVTTQTLVASAGPDAEIIEGKSIELRATGGTQYLWSPAEGLNSATIANPIASPTKTTTYTVTVTSEAGCTDTDEVTITVIPRVVIVNTFSPNRDGINETWEIKNVENFPSATVEIFNRWGAQVFKSEDGYKQPWNGTFKGKDLPLATYYYVIRLTKDEKPITGSVTIIR